MRWYTLYTQTICIWMSNVDEFVHLLGDIFRFIVDYRKHPQHRRRWNGAQNQEDINIFSTRLNYSFQWNKSLYDKYILGNFENTKTVWKYNCCTIGKVRFIYEALHWAIIWSPGNLNFFFTGIPQGPLETSPGTIRIIQKRFQGPPTNVFLIF